MSQQMPTDPLASAVQLLSAGGLGAVLLKVVERMFARKDRADDEAVSYRKELREEISQLRTRQDELEHRLDTERERAAGLVAERAALRAENHAIRSENHQLRNFLAGLVLHAQVLHRKCGLPDADLPKLPEWLLASSEGPTRGPSVESEA